MEGFHVIGLEPQPEAHFPRQVPTSLHLACLSEVGLDWCGSGGVFFGQTQAEGPRPHQPPSAFLIPARPDSVLSLGVRTPPRYNALLLFCFIAISVLIVMYYDVLHGELPK